MTRLRYLKVPGWRERVQPGRAALVVIDMQNDFVDPAGAMARRGFDVSAVEAMAARLARLLETARATQIPIVHVRTYHTPWTDSDAWTSRPLRVPEGEQPMCFPGSWGAEFYPATGPRQNGSWVPGDDEYVVTKHRYSAFSATDLDMVLRSLHRHTIILTGTTTQTCVDSTARDGLMHDYKVVLVEDCVAAVQARAHDDALEILDGLIATILPAAALVDAWSAGRSPVQLADAEAVHGS